MRDYNYAIPAVEIILQQEDGAIFLLHRINTNFEVNKWCTVGGHVEKDETPRQTAIRETLEEAGISVQLQDMQALGAFYKIEHGNPSGMQQWIHFVFVCRKWQGQPHLAEPEKFNQVGWYRLEALPEPQVYFLKTILDFLHKGREDGPYADEIDPLTP